jgi:hypothetical protein
MKQKVTQFKTLAIALKELAALTSVIVVLLMSYKMGPCSRASNDTSDTASLEVISRHR